MHRLLTSQLGEKLWLLMSMRGSSAAGCCGPRTRNALDVVIASAQPAAHSSLTAQHHMTRCVAWLAQTGQHLYVRLKSKHIRDIFDLLEDAGLIAEGASTAIKQAVHKKHLAVVRTVLEVFHDRRASFQARR